MPQPADSVLARAWSVVRGVALRPAGVPHEEPSESGLVRAAALFFGLLAWVGSWRSPTATATAALDPSCIQAIGVALKRGLQFGDDVVFTYGPLGYFTTAPYDPDLYWIKVLAWDMAFKAVIALGFVLAWLRLRGWSARILFPVALLLPGMGIDAQYMLGLFAAASFAWSLPSRDGRTPWLRAAIAMSAMILVALVKFSYFLLLLPCAAAVIAIFIAHRGRRAGAMAAALIAAIFLAIWTSLGQSPANIASWFVRSAEIAQAYGEGMSLPAADIDLSLAQILLALGAIFVVLHVSLDHRSVHRWAMALALTCGLFLAFRAGFTRAVGSQLTFYGFAGAAPFLIEGARRDALDGKPWRRRARSLVRAANAIISLCSLALCAGLGADAPVEMPKAWLARLEVNLEDALKPAQIQREYESQLEHLRQRFDAPHARSSVARETLDVFGSEQGVAFLNRFEWRPRPVFQAYAAMSATLSGLNARFLESSRAPQFFLYRSNTIDSRLPCMDDGSSLAVMLRDYQPVLAENAFLLFHRRADAPRTGADARTIVVERTIHFDETVELGSIEGRCHLMSLDIRSTQLGRLRALTYQAGVVHVVIETSDGGRGWFRILPSLMRAGVIVNPWLPNQASWVRWVSGESLPHIVSLKVLPPVPSGLYEDEIALKLERCDALAPEPDAALAGKLAWSMFETRPDRVTCAIPAQRVTFRGRLEVMLVHTPSKLDFDLAPGRYVLRGQYGFLREAVTQGQTDGAVFKVILEDSGAAPRVLFERFLDPIKVGEDRFLQTLDVPFELTTSAEITLAADPGPGGSPNGDLVFWTGISFEKQP